MFLTGDKPGIRATDSWTIDILSSAANTALAQSLSTSFIDTARRGFGLKPSYGTVIDSSVAVKLGPDVRSYEYRILQLLARIDGFPAPKPLDFFTIKISRPGIRRGSKLEQVWGVLYMSTIPGRPLSDAIYEASVNGVPALRAVRYWMDRANEALADGLVFTSSDGSEQVVSRPPLTMIGNLDGDRCEELPLLPSTSLRRSVDLVDFIPRMTRTASTFPSTAPDRDAMLAALCPPNFLHSPSHTGDLAPVLTCPQHRIRFCHMDLHSSNILVDGDRLTGIVDWETAGWYTQRMEEWAGMRNAARSPLERQMYAAAWSVDPSLMILLPRYTLLLYEARQWASDESKKEGRRKKAEMMLRRREEQERQGCPIPTGAAGVSTSGLGGQGEEAATDDCAGRPASGRACHRASCQHPLHPELGDSKQV